MVIFRLCDFSIDLAYADTAEEDMLIRETLHMSLLTL